MLGIDNLKKVLKIVLDMANVADKIGHVTGPQRWVHLSGVVGALLTLPSVDFKQVGAELKDMDKDERAQLLEDLKGGLELHDEKLEAAIAEGIAILVEAEALVDRAMKMAKSFKGEEQAQVASAGQGAVDPSVQS